MKDTPINVEYPEAEELRLRVALGACRFRGVPGEGGGWIGGAHHDPGGRRTPEISHDGGTVGISEGEYTWERMTGFLGGVPRYDLSFGKGRPFELVVETGASEFELDLGGVPVSRMVVRQGAGSFGLEFSAPNPEPMSLLEISSGAAGIELENLANANFAEMRLTGGAAGYELDFGGDLRRDAEAKIEAGLSAVEISVPASTPTRVTTETTLGGLDVGDGFTKRDGAFWTEAGAAGGTPLLKIHVGVRLGSVQLRAT